MEQTEQTFEVPYNVREQNFSLKHHDTVGPFVDILLSVYTTCQWKEAGSHVDLDKAHLHVFGNETNSHQPCPWCKSTFESRLEHQKEFFN